MAAKSKMKPNKANQNFHIFMDTSIMTFKTCRDFGLAMSTRIIQFLRINPFAGGWSLWGPKAVKSTFWVSVLMSQLHIIRNYPQFYFYTFNWKQNFWKNNFVSSKKFFLKAYDKFKRFDLHKDDPPAWAIFDPASVGVNFFTYERSDRSENNR